MNNLTRSIRPGVQERRDGIEAMHDRRDADVGRGMMRDGERGDGEALGELRYARKPARWWLGGG